jgi:hypothetical protein
MYLALLLLGVGTANAAPVEAYGAYPTLEYVVISPNGERLAYATGNEAARVVVELAKRMFPFCLFTARMTRSFRSSRAN